MFENNFLRIDQLNLAIFNNCHKIIINDSTYSKVFKSLFIITVYIL